MHRYPTGNGILAPAIPRHFAALMDALQLNGASTDALAQLDTSDWEQLLDFCDRAHLTLALTQIASPDIPAWVVHRLEKNLTSNALRSKRLLTTYAEAADALRQSGISHLVVKGFTQAPNYVKHPRLRIQGDLDIFCPVSQVAQAQASLQAIGYTPVDNHDYLRADHLPALTRLGGWKWKGNIYDPDMPPSIELHFCLWNEGALLIEVPEVESFWSRRQDRNLEGVNFPALCPVDHLGYFALHIVRGIIWGDWIVHHVLELAEFLDGHAHQDQFWKDWIRLHSAHLRSLEAIAFWLAEAWFSCNVHSDVRAQIDSLPPAQKQWLEQFGGSPLEGMFRRSKDGRLLQLLLAKSRSAQRTVIQHAISPPDIVNFFRRSRKVWNQRSAGITHINGLPGYLLYFARRLPSDLRASVVFMAHGLLLWLSRRQLRAQFLLFLVVSFFLTWACLHTSSFSTCS